MKFKSILISIMLVLLLGNLFSAPVVFNYMEMNGKIGSAYKFSSDDDTSDADVMLTNFDLSLEVNPNDIFSGYIGLIYNGEMNHMEVEEAYAKVRIMDQYPLHMTAGKFFLPTSIASDYTHFITDPMTYTFSETNQSAIMADFAWETLTLKAGFYREVEDDFDDDTNIDSYVINLATQHQIEEVDFMISGSYLSNLANSVFLENLIFDEIGAVTIGATVNWKEFSFLGEYLMTLDEINAEKPSLMHAELSFLASPDMLIAGMFSMSQDAEGLLAENSFGGIATYTFMRNSFSQASISAEYIMENDYSDNSTNNSQLKLTYKF